MQTAAEFILGMILGYVTISMCESFFHRHIQHASKKTRFVYSKLGLVGRALIDAWYSHHVVHHYLTFRSNHVTQFASEDEEIRLRNKLTNKGKADIVECSYGARIGLRVDYFARYMAPTLFIVVAVCAIGGSRFTAGCLFPLAIWPLLAEFVHPYLHMRYDEVQNKAPPIIALLSRTRYFRYLAIHHWMHHRYETCNYNLLLGGDYLLGVHTRPSRADIDQMRRDGLWVES